MAPREAFSAWWAALASSHVARVLTAKRKSQSATEYCASGPGRLTPALLTSASRPPKRSTAAATTLPGASAVPRSPWSGNTSAPAFCSSSTTRSRPEAAPMSTAAIFAPPRACASRASLRHVARPIPLAAPVTSARIGTSEAGRSRESDLLEIAQDAGVDQLPPRRGGQRVGRCRLARVRQSGSQRRLAAVQRAGEAIRDVVGQRGTREDQAPGPDRRQRRAEARIGAGRDRERLQERVLHLDLLDPGRVGHEEARAGRATGDGGEPGPADAAAPQRRRAAVEHHGRTVAGPVQEDGREVARLIEAQTIEHVAREDHQAGAARAEDD